MATTQLSTTKNDPLQAADKQIEQYSLKIAKSLKSMLHDEKADTDKMLGMLCTGIIGLTLASSKRRDLVTKIAKDDLSKFVLKEMERVRKQSRLRTFDVYKEEYCLDHT